MIDKIFIAFLFVVSLAASFVVSLALAAAGHPSSVWLMELLGVM